MKRILLATAATLALSLPAVAAPANAPATNTSSQQMNQTTPSHMNNAKMNNAQSQKMNSKAGTNQQAQTKEQQRINPKQLSKKEIKSIQQALNKKGFSAGHVDGIWGRDTDVAIRNFQKKQGLPGSGHLNQQTLAALGVNMSQRTSGTVGAGTHSGSMNSTSGSMNSGSGHMNSSTNGMNTTPSSSTHQNQAKPSNPSSPK